MNNRAVLITGASSGIGKITAQMLDREGFAVYAGVRKQADAEALEKAGSERLTPVIVDVSQPESVADAARAVRDSLGSSGLYGLVNNAGVVNLGPVEFHNIEAARAMLEINVLGLVRITQAFMPLVRAADGRVVNMGSIMGRIAFPYTGLYNASKFAVEGLTDALRMELKPWGIHVSLVEPGPINTPFWDHVADSVAGALPEEGRRLYADSYAAAGASMAELASNAIAPEAVAKTVVRALKSKKPKTRYLVGRDARFLSILANYVPDRLRDYLLMRQLNMPRKL